MAERSRASIQHLAHAQGPEFNPATATDKNYDGFSGCSFASILIDCIATITLSQVLDWARQLAINNRGNSRGG